MILIPGSGRHVEFKIEPKRLGEKKHVNSVLRDGQMGVRQKEIRTAKKR